MSGLAKDARTWLAMLPEAELNALKIETSPSAASGYMGVIQIKGGKWAGRITQRKRQLHVPGIFEEPLQAAQMRAYFLKHDAVLPSPPKRAKRGTAAETHAEKSRVGHVSPSQSCESLRAMQAELMQEPQPCVVMAVPCSTGSVLSPDTVCVGVCEL